MRTLKLLAAAALAATSLTSTSAFADVSGQKTSFDQGILVHTNGEQTGQTVTGTLGAGPSAPAIVQFDGSTTATSDVTDFNDVHLQNGNGQAELTGAEFGGSDTNLQMGDIYLNNGGPDNIGMSWIELAFTDVTADTVTFTLALLGEPDAMFTFDIDHTPNGENKFGFFAANGESILNLNYAFDVGSNDPGVAGAVRQVRIIPFGSSIPEPSTWAMMLLGFGAAGVAMRRSRKKGLVSQLA